MGIVKKYWIVFVFLILLFSLLLFLVFYLIAINSLEYANPGAFGDFMGGVIGTIFTVIASIFVYATYQTQRKQLELQKKEIDQNIIDNLYDKILKEIDSFKIEHDGRVYEGIEVLQNFQSLYNNTKNSVLDQLNLILISFDHLFYFNDRLKFKYQIQKKVNKDRCYLLFYTKIIWPFNEFYSVTWDVLIDEWKPPHPDSQSTKERFEKLTKKTYKYLLERKLVGEPVDGKYRKLLGLATP